MKSKLSFKKILIPKLDIPKIKCYLNFLFFTFLVTSCVKETTSTTGSGGTQIIVSAPVVQVSAITSTSFTASWAIVNGADKYALYVATDNQFTQLLTGYNPLILAGVTATLNNLTAGTTYYVKVKALQGSNESVFSNTVMVNTIAKQWVVTTFAGTLSSTTGYADGVGTQAKFNFPSGIAIDAADNLYVVDGGTRVRKITATGTVTTFCGTGVLGNIDGAATTAQLDASSIAYDASTSSLYVDGTNCIRKINASGTITTVAGNTNIAGVVDGQGTTARLYGVNCITTDASGNLYIYEFGNNTGISDAIRKLSPSGYLSTIKTPFNLSTGYSRGMVYYNGYLYLLNPWAFSVLKVSLTGTSTLFAGQPSINGSYLDGDISIAKFGFLQGITVDASGNFYISDILNKLIRKISNNIVTTFAGALYGNGSSIYEGPALSVRILNPSGLVVDSKGNIFFLDTDYNCIRKISYQ